MTKTQPPANDRQATDMKARLKQVQQSDNLQRDVLALRGAVQRILTFYD